MYLNFHLVLFLKGLINLKKFKEFLDKKYNFILIYFLSKNTDFFLSKLDEIEDKRIL
jgi:hypothetical protein